MEEYRNKVIVVTISGEYIDAESLWKRNGDVMTLVDDDRHEITSYTEVVFYKVET